MCICAPERRGRLLRVTIATIPSATTPSAPTSRPRGAVLHAHPPITPSLLPGVESGVPPMPPVPVVAPVLDTPLLLAAPLLPVLPFEVLSAMHAWLAVSQIGVIPEQSALLLQITQVPVGTSHTFLGA